MRTAWNAAVPDLSDVVGQEQARRALEVAAAGGHHLLFMGPPGCGKSMLARRLPGILPPLESEEALQVTSVYSVSTRVPRPRGLLSRRPFRAPHHTISNAALIGGGTSPQPGEVSLAHHGVLFLDELTEFRRDVLEGLRQPLEDRTVTVARAQATLTFPSAFQMVAAANPCPCGYLGDERRECVCTPPAVDRYRSRLSGPLLDRLDLQVSVASVPWRELSRDRRGETSAAVAARVAAARLRARERFGPGGPLSNGDMGSEAIRQWAGARRRRKTAARTRQPGSRVVGEGLAPHPQGGEDHRRSRRRRSGQSPPRRRGHRLPKPRPKGRPTTPGNPRSGQMNNNDRRT